MSVAFVTGCHAPMAGSAIPSYDGAMLYRGHCASCHGITGAGDGPMVAQLNIPPIDLRTLSELNDGTFPRLAVMRQIDGRDQRIAHGTRDMPVWGWQFSQAENDDRDSALQASARINALADYLESIQQ